MSESDFWESPLWVVLNRIKGYSDREQREWQRASWQVYYLGHWKKGSNINPQKLAPWAWDLEKQKPLTLEEQQARFGKADAYMKKLIAEKEKNG